MADLRASVAYLIRLRIPWRPEDLATLAAVPLPRARAYVTHLDTWKPKPPPPPLPGEHTCEPPPDARLYPGAVRTMPDGTVIPGPYAREWLDWEPATRPGGNSVEYRRQREVRAALEQRAWLAARAGDLLTSDPAGSPENPTEPQGSVPNVPVPQPLTDVPLTVKQAAEQLQVLPETVREWIHSGRLRAWRVGPQQIRVSQSEVTALLQPVAPRRGELVRRG